MYQALIVFGILLPATISDLYSYRIPNIIIMSGFAITFLCKWEMQGVLGIFTWLTGAFLSCLLMYFFYLIGAVGAADIKLLSVIGSFYGIYFTMDVMIYAILTGGVFSLGIIFLQILNHQPLSISKREGVKQGRNEIPFALCISIGTFFVLLEGDGLFS